ncbi:ABC transporter ATP-binding protein [Cupriavidus sp. 2KB_3]
MAGKDLCVEVSGVSKKFARSLKRSFVYGARDIARAAVGRSPGMDLRESEFWAVCDVSFALERGKAIGIVGLNGSGKTTLLRMVAGILKPTSGTVRINGVIAPMLALGAGFKPVLSGRENIFLNMSLLGVPQREIAQRFDEVVDFAELWDAIDAPIGTYSSGMLSRLGFACAVHTNPSILIVDEVLSVGDTKFRMKCRNHLNTLRRNGTSMLLVSHSAVLVETLSDECIYMKKGQVTASGTPSEVLKIYDADSIQAATADNERRIAAAATSDFSECGLRGVEFGPRDQPDLGFWLAGKPGELLVRFYAPVMMDELSINLMIFDLTHQPGETVQFMSSSKDIGWLRAEAGMQEVRLNFDAVGLRPGTYRIKLSLSQGEMHDLIDGLDNIKLVVRDAGLGANCLYYQPRSWDTGTATISRPAEEFDQVDLQDESF